MSITVSMMSFCVPNNKPTQEEVDAKVKAHQLWLKKMDGGERADFREMNLENADFSGKDLSEAQFDGSFLKDANFDSAKLVEASFCQTYFPKASFKQADLTEAEFIKAHGLGANFNKATLGGVDCYTAAFWDCDFTGADLTYVYKEKDFEVEF